jgi:tetratricopeptide (TPR) repeat protein
MNANPTAGLTPITPAWTAIDRLDSWKEIATYLRREVRTVQLWEKKEGLPVHRHFHQQLGSVFAFRSEIDRWRREVSRHRSSLNETGSAPAVAADRITIRVFPLENSSNHASREICNLIQAKTIAELERLNPEKLAVARVESNPESKPTNTSITDGQEDNYQLKWKVEAIKESLKITAELICGRTRKVEWSHVYPSDPKSWHDTPQEIAQQISQCLWLKMVYRPRPISPERRRQELQAREAYLKGRYFWEQRSEAGLKKAVQFFKAAIHEDPGFALPYSGLADSLTLLSFYEILPSSQIMPAARRAALKAVELNPDLAEAHASLADVMLHFDRDWQGAEHEYRRTIQCNPSYALGYHWYSNLLAARGQHDAAHIAIMNALEIDPVSIITLVWAGVTSYLARQFDEAITHYRNALELAPDFVWAHMYLAQALEQKGNLKEALREFETAIRLAQGNHCVRAMKAHTHALAGDNVSAREMLRDLNSPSSPGCMPSYDIAATYAALGEPNRMIAWLNRACQERNMKLFTLPQDPRFDSFRRRDDFKEVVAHIGLSRM